MMGRDEDVVDDVLNEGRKVMVFYSSEEHPQLLDEYEEVLNNLADIGIETDVVDITEGLEKAQEHDIRTAPVVVVIENGEETKYQGVVKGLREVLEGDLLGKSTLFDTCFERGRKAAQGQEIDDGVTEEEVEPALEDLLSSKVGSLTVDVLDVDVEEAKLSVVPPDNPPEDNDVIGHDEFGAVFKGFFTELFGTTVVEEVTCAREGGKRCVFEIEGTSE